MHRFSNFVKNLERERSNSFTLILNTLFLRSWLNIKIKCFIIYRETEDDNYCFINHQKVKYTNSFISLTHDTN